ncbi:MAG: iron-containing alcohol dehydrogenase, partial [Pirellula sp.]
MRLFNSSFQNHLPRRVLTGRGESLKLGNLCQQLGYKRVFLVSDEGLARAGIVDLVHAPLVKQGLSVGSFLAVPAEPPIETVDWIARQIRDCKADAVIGLGGGSVMDATKVASVVADRNCDASSLVGIGKVERRGLPTILVPTTAGTGSEATFVAILTDTHSGNKIGVVDPALLADIAVVDPSLTDALPPSITAATGMDAIVHAIEAFIATVATPIARGLALEAAKFLGAAISVVYQQPTNKDARDRMAIGSHLAGIAFANSSCCAVHALALPLGGRFAIPHGVITGCFAGEMMRHNADVCESDFRELGMAFGWGATDIEAFSRNLDSLAESLGLVDAIKAYAIPGSVIPAMAKDVA